MKNDPSFAYDTVNNNLTKREKSTAIYANSRASVQAKKTDVAPKAKVEVSEPAIRCLLHNADCKAFKVKPFEERKDFLKKKGMCYKCSLSRHLANTCTENVCCAECGSKWHPTALHINTNSTSTKENQTTENNGKKRDKNTSSNAVSSKCTQICGETFRGKSCAKTVLVKVYPNGQPDKSVNTYAILDDQSNSSLARTDFFELMNIHGERIPYTLSSCAGLVKTSGRRASNFVVESLDGSSKLKLPTLIECNEIPEVWEEIAIPAVALNYPHLVDIADQIPPLNNSARILLLIGRDMIEAHHVLDQRIGPGRAPYAQRLSLGWVIIGEACLGKVHKPDVVNVNKTNLLNNGRASIFKACPNNIKLKDSMHSYYNGEPTWDMVSQNQNSTDSLFHVTKDDDKPGLSVEDEQFLQVMDNEMFKGPEGNWVAPFHFGVHDQLYPTINSRQPKELRLWRKV